MFNKQKSSESVDHLAIFMQVTFRLHNYVVKASLKLKLRIGLH